MVAYQSRNYSLLIMLVFIVCSEPASAITQRGISVITNNDFDDLFPMSDHGVITWFGCPTNDCTPFGGNYEIYMWQGGEVIRITDSPGSDRYPVIQDGAICWSGIWEEKFEILQWLDGETVPLLSGAQSNTEPRMWQERVVWQGFDGEDFEIYFFDGEIFTQLTDNHESDTMADVSEYLVAWVWGETDDRKDREIRYWDGLDIHTITNNETEDTHPATWGEWITWEGFNEGDKEIYLWDGERKLQISNNSYDDQYPNIDNGWIVWEAMIPSSNTEIFYYHEGRVDRLTVNDFPDNQPFIFGDRICWQACPDNDCPFFGGGNWEIYFWEGEAPVRITFNKLPDYSPIMDDTQIVWMGQVSDNMELFRYPIAVTPTPGPSPTPSYVPIYLTLQLNKHVFEAGDNFDLRLTTVNREEFAMIDQFVLLEFYDSYWFWPSWSLYPPDIDYDRRQVPAHEILEETLLYFTWPEGAGTGFGVNLWAIAMQAGTYLSVSNIANDYFNFR